MPSKTRRNRKSIKGSGIGLIADRMYLSKHGHKIQTYCCDTKESDTVLGTGYNIGKGCEPSISGQCLPGYAGQSYKFRCRLNPDEYYTDTKFNTIDESKDQGKCTYVAGILGKIGSTVTNIPAVALDLAGVNSKKKLGIAGGKKQQRRKTTKRRRTNKRKYNNIVNFRIENV
jgi:hypothetical protein